MYSALVGGGIFVLSYFFLQLGLLVSLGFTVAAYAAAIFLVFPSKVDQQAAELADTLRGVLKEGDEKIKQMRSIGKQIKNESMRAKVFQMCDVGQQIFETAKKKPKDVRSVQQFSSYYLESTIKIIQKYLELSGHRSYSPEIQKALEKVESTLNGAQLAFQKQLEALVREDVLDLDTEMSVLEETLELEGWEVHDEE